MELLSHHLALGFATAASWGNLFYCLVGVFLGTAIGVLPGLGPVATIAMLLPVTFGLPPVTALIMLAGIFYGAQYGGSTTAILVNLPGESSSVVTALDGYQMARRGRAGMALATAAIASFFAGTVCTFLIALAAPPLSEMALKFGPADYFSLMVLGLVASIVLASGSLLHAIGMIVLGLLLGLIGTDVNSGTARFSFDSPELLDGMNFVVVAMGVFGLGEIIANLEDESHAHRSTLTKITGLMPSREDFKRMVAPILRGTRWARSLGILPGGGAMLSSFAAYSLEKKVSRNSAEFGKGAIEGVAGAGVRQQRRRAGIVHPDAHARHPVEPGDGADDRRADHARHPARAGCDGRAARAVLGPGRVDVDRQPVPAGSQPAADRPVGEDDLGARITCSIPAILVFCAIGVFSLANTQFDVYLMALFGVLGYVVPQARLRAGADDAGLHPRPDDGGVPAPRAADLKGGSAMVLVTRPISATLLAVSAIALVIVLLPALAQEARGSVPGMSSNHRHDL